MGKIIRFPLKMKNGAEVRTLEELRENFDLESVLGYFTDGMLQTWLANRYYDEQAEAVGALSADMPDLNARLCEILGVEYQADADETDLEAIQRRKEKLQILQQVTDDPEILKNVDLVAMSQDELFDILDEDPSVVYLYGERFSIPFGKKNVTYIGINNPEILLEPQRSVTSYAHNGISFRATKSLIMDTAELENLFLQGKQKEVFPMLKEAADNGNPRARFIITLFYRNGYHTVQIDRNTEKFYYIDALSYQDSLLMYRYAFDYIDKDSQKISKLCSQFSNGIQILAEAGDPFAQFCFGSMYYYGMIGRKGYSADKNKAALWWRKAAEQGLAEARYDLGTLYSVWAGGSFNCDERNKSAELFAKAAEQGHAGAEKKLGDCYIHGWGVEVNYSIALEWLLKSAEQGYPDAQLELAELYQNGYCVPKDLAKAREWYIKAQQIDESLDYDDDRDDECDDVVDIYVVRCPKCGREIELMEEELDSGVTLCIDCGNSIEFDIDEIE